MHTVDSTGKTDQAIITIITNAGRTAEKWEAARKNLGLKVSLRSHEKSEGKNERKNKENITTKEQRSDNKFKKDQCKKMDQPDRKTYKETKGIDSAEVERSNAAGECLRCAWPSDRKGSHRVKDCKRPIKLHQGTASYPKSE